MRVKRLAGIEGVDRRHALVDRRAALDHERAQTGARQVERAEQAGGAGAHHDRARLVLRLRGITDLRNLQLLVRPVRLHIRGAFAVRRCLDCRSFGLGAACQFHAKRCHEVHIVLFARVDAALEQANLGDIVRRHVKRSGRGAAHELFGLLAFEPGIERKGKVRDFKHGFLRAIDYDDGRFERRHRRVGCGICRVRPCAKGAVFPREKRSGGYRRWREHANHRSAT